MPYADKEKQRQAQRDSARRRRSAQGSQGSLPSTRQPRTLANTVPLPARVETAQEILTLLGITVAEVRADENAGPLDRARVIGYLCGIALRAVETANLEARLAALEEAMNAREGVRLHA